VIMGYVLLSVGVTEMVPVGGRDVTDPVAVSVGVVVATLVAVIESVAVGETTVPVADVVADVVAVPESDDAVVVGRIMLKTDERTLPSVVLVAAGAVDEVPAIIESVDPAAGAVLEGITAVSVLEAFELAGAAVVEGLMRLKTEDRRSVPVAAALEVGRALCTAVVDGSVVSTTLDVDPSTGTADVTIDPTLLIKGNRPAGDVEEPDEEDDGTGASGLTGAELEAAAEEPAALVAAAAAGAVVPAAVPLPENVKPDAGATEAA
jgi:hypothetical protein